MKAWKWNNPFNKIVRSHEAGIIGIGLGVILGVLLILFTPIVIDYERIEKVSELCGNHGIEQITVSYIGSVKELRCEDGRFFNNF